jgi:hypothetical protein
MKRLLISLSSISIVAVAAKGGEMVDTTAVSCLLVVSFAVGFVVRLAGHSAEAAAPPISIDSHCRQFDYDRHRRGNPKVSIFSRTSTFKSVTSIDGATGIEALPVELTRNTGVIRCAKQGVRGNRIGGFVFGVAIKSAV